MDFYDDFLALTDIQKGDILDVASDMLSIALFCKRKKIVFSPDKLLDALIDIVGEDGTVLVRTFNWDFCHDIPFDYKRTSSKVGSLGNVALGRSDFKRTQHPLYSWAVWGKDQEYLCGLKNTKSFGEGTPWQYFEEKNAKFIRLGNATVPGFTFLHHIEQELQIDYRFEKTFRGKYLDAYERESIRDYSMYVRKLDRDIIFNTEGSFERMRAENVINEEKYEDQLNIFTVAYSDAYKLVRRDFACGLEEKWTMIKFNDNN